MRLQVYGLWQSGTYYSRQEIIICMSFYYRCAYYVCSYSMALQLSWINPNIQVK